MLTFWISKHLCNFLSSLLCQEPPGLPQKTASESSKSDSRPHLRAARTLATADVKSTSAPQFLSGGYSNISEQLPGNPWPKLPLLISLIHQQSWSVLKLFKSCHYLQFQNSMESPEVELRNCVRLRNNPKGRQLWTGWVQLRFRRSSKPYLHHMSRIETSPKDLPSLRQWCDSVPEPSCATCVGEKR